MNVAHIERLGNPGVSPTLLVEVPHGADERAHYDALRARITGALPADLHRWFHVNTDIGAWDYGLAAARAYVERSAGRSAVAVRCLLPRTLIDVNRVLGADTGALGRGGVTSGLPPYITQAADQQLLVALHQRYTQTVEALYEQVCGHGGLAVLAHSYAPRSVGIERVDEHIVDNLHRFYQPGVIETQPLRHEVDLLTETPDGTALSCPGLAQGVQNGLVELGYEVVRNGTYRLVPQSMGAVWAARYPGQTLCMEVRRDRLCNPWLPFEPQSIDGEATRRIGEVVARAAAAAL